MATNYPGPYEIRINYSTVAGGLTLAHQHRFSLGLAVTANPGDPFEDWTPQGKLSEYGEDLAGYIDGYVTLIQPFFRTDVDIVTAELWEYETGTNNAAFRSIYTLGLNGTSSSTAVQDGQVVISFRTTLGGTKKMDFRETVYPQAVFQLFPTNVAAVNSYAAFVTGANTPLLGWDNGFVFSAYKYLPGLNEKATRKRLR